MFRHELKHSPKLHLQELLYLDSCQTKVQERLRPFMFDLKQALELVRKIKI